jgi:hypothetical protein
LLRTSTKNSILKKQIELAARRAASFPVGKNLFFS